MESAARVAGMTYLAVVVSALLGVTVPSERPGPTAIGGMALVIFAILSAAARRPHARGRVFGLFLILAGIERFLVEEIALTGLHRDEIAQLWSSVFGESGDHSIIEKVHSATLGNPLALRSALREVIRHGTFYSGGVQGSFLPPRNGVLDHALHHRVGLLADIVGALAGAKINITALDAISVHGRYGALLWVAPKDLKKAQKAIESRAAPVDAVAAVLATLGP